MSTWCVAPSFDPLRRRHGWSSSPQDIIAARSRRLLLLVIAMALMGLCDLACTLTYMSTSGMLEMNPIARLMVYLGQERQLIIFKLCTMSVCFGALILGRRHSKAERCAWACTALMLALMLQWASYNREVPVFTNDIATLAMSNGEFEPRWVKLD